MTTQTIAVSRSQTRLTGNLKAGGDEDLSKGWAAELTGSVGLSDQPNDGDMIPDHLADAVESYDSHAALTADASGASDTPPDIDNHVSDLVDGIDASAEDGKKHVPLAALHEERRARQQLQEQLQAQEAQLILARQQAQQAFVQQQQALLQQQAAAQQAALEAQIPSFEEDPEGHMNARFALVQQQQAAQQQQQYAEIAQQQQLQANREEFVRQATELAPLAHQAEVEFAAQNPDYHQAFTWLESEVDRRMQLDHPGSTPEFRQSMRTIAQMTFIKECAARGENPCAGIYRAAKDMGYGQRVPNAQRPVPPTSLSNLGGAPRAPDEGGKIGLSQVAAMSDAEFDKFFDGMKKQSTVRPSFGR